MHVVARAEEVERLREERVRVPVVERDVRRRAERRRARARGRAPSCVEHASGRARSRRGSTPPSAPGTAGASAVVDAVARRAARAGSRPGRRPSSRRGSRAGAGATRTRSRTSSSSGCRAAARSSSARASRARARRRSRGPSPSAAARAGATHIARALPVRERPPCCPITSASSPCSSSSCERLRVVARGDLDLVAALPQDRDQRPEDEHVRARRHVDPDPHASDRLAPRRHVATGRALDVALVPEREREQAPELAAPVLAAGDVLVEEARDRRSGRKKPWRAASSARERRRARTARARRAARRRPGSRSRACGRATIARGSSGSAALRRSTFLRQAAHLVPRRQREREVRHDRVEERHARLERVRHRRAVGLHEQVVDEVRAEVDVLEAREQLGALGLAKRVAQEVDRVERRRGGRSAPRARPGEKISFQP